jgi:hypothetical protein
MIAGILIIVLIGLVIFVGPALIIWALNVLLASIGIATIALCFKTWLAAFVLMLMLGGTASKR